jgi:hypothetical protein
METVRMRTATYMGLLLALVPSHLLAAVPLPTVREPYCARGPEIYRNVAKDRDSGHRKEYDYREWVVGPPGPNQNRSRVEAEQHNKLVREIYAHPEWSPDEVAKRWLTQCKAHLDRRTNDGAPWVIVDTLE